MLNLKELRFSGIGRFVEEQVIDFDKLGNLVQLDGLNKNTNGSSGAGKTTVFNALDYLLGLNDVPNTILESRLGTGGIKVSATFDYEGKVLKITRNKGKLAVELEGETEVKGSNKLSEEKLDKILAMPKSLFRPLCHKRQGEGGFFLNLTPGKINEFLTDCLGLSEYKAKLALIDTKVSEKTLIKTRNEQYLKESQSALKATQDAVLALGLAPIRDMHQDVIVQLKAKYDASSSSLGDILIKQKLDTEALDLQRPIVEKVSFDTSEKEKLEAELQDLHKQANSLLLAEKDRQASVNTAIAVKTQEKRDLLNDVKSRDNIKTEATKTALAIKTLRESICPTCAQPWHTDSAKKEETDLLARLAKFKEIINLGNAAENRVPTILADLQRMEEIAKPKIPEGISDLQKREESARKRISEILFNHRDKETATHYLNTVRQEQFADQQKKLRDKHASESDQARGQADIDRRALEAAVGKLKAYDSALKNYDENYAKLKHQENAHQKTLESIERNLATVTVELNLAEELKKAVKSYLSCSFDDALEHISDTATKIIRAIPNMANATIQLEGIKETKEGKVKEEVNAVIHLDGEEAVPIKSLCGGERSATDLAVDLALIDLIENRTGKGINIFILDEPFNGLDTVCIEMALDVLKNSNINKKLIIVDHNPEVKQMVESRLVSVREGATSQVVQE